MRRLGIAVEVELGSLLRIANAVPISTHYEHLPDAMSRLGKNLEQQSQVRRGSQLDEGYFLGILRNQIVQVIEGGGSQ